MSSIIRDVSLLHPKFRGRAVELNEFLAGAYKSGATKTLFQIFETFRSPQRQADMIAKGVSKAGPYESAHCLGLAADFVPVLSPEEAAALSERIGERVFPGWNWHSTNDYRFLATAAKKFALAAPISWDPCHIEHPQWPSILKDIRANLK